GPRRLRRLGCRVDHLVIDHELIAAVEKLGQRALAARAFEDVLLLDQLPWEISARLAQLVALPCELLLVGEKLRPRRHPFLVRNDPVLHVSSYSQLMVAYPITKRNRRLR